MGKTVSIRFREILDVEEVISRFRDAARVEVLTEVQARENRFPIYAIHIGPEDRTTPVLGLFAGVHGLEKVGTHVVLAYLRTMAGLLRWDELFQELVSKIRIIAVPLVNPGGMYLRRRANPRGVDLMRNAPVDAIDSKGFSLVAGHRISPRLPWYRGEEGAPMEAEARAVRDLVKREFADARFAISIDVHSGFGLRDRLWFPFARSLSPFPHLPEVFALKVLLKQTYPNHIYRFEPQCLSYTTHGDLWDHLYDLHYEGRRGVSTYLPLTLELGSWLWVKKNPRQLLTFIGLFNPMIPHRYQRTMRRHLQLFDFLGRAVLGYRNWICESDDERTRLRQLAMEKWF